MALQSTPALQPITESPEVIAGYLKELNTAALIMSVVHMTGDTRLLQELPTPRTLDVVAAGAEAGEELLEGGYTPAQVADLHQRALTAIADWQARGCTLEPLTDTTIQALYRFMCGADVDPEYLEFIDEEVAIDGVDRRGLHFDDPALQARAAEFPVVVIGAWRRRGFPIQLLKKIRESAAPGTKIGTPVVASMSRGTVTAIRLRPITTGAATFRWRMRFAPISTTVPAAST